MKSVNQGKITAKNHNYVLNFTSFVKGSNININFFDTLEMKSINKEEKN